MIANHILIVECEKGMQRILALTLKRAAFEISVVASCAEIAEKVSESNKNGNQVNLLLLDVHSNDNCKGVSGKLEFCGQGLPIIALVGYGDEAKIDKRFREKCSMLLCKPVEAQELIEGINAVLNN